MVRGTVSLSLLCYSLAFVGTSAAQGYPSRPIQFVVPYPPGGGNDIFARFLAGPLHEALGQPVVVDNRAGAGGTIGTASVAKAAPDGHTLLLGSSGALAVAPSLIPKLSYDPLKDLAPITMLATVPNILAVHPSVPVHSVKQLIALAKADPGRLTFGSSGIGGSGHLAGELFNAMAGVKMTHIAYRGTGLSVNGLLSGEIAATFENMLTLLPHVKAGRIRALAVTSVRRAPAVPELPTIAESGLPGYSAGPWFAILTTGGTPAEVVNLLNREFLKILKRPDMVKVLSGRGAELVMGTPAELSEYLQAETSRWAKVIRDANITVK
jgi:tripartite-type tricarboxylate transporter receptor subunit TctC